MDFFARLDSLRDRWNVLEHPFYTRWSEGKLERDELAFYAGEYRHAVIALAEAVDAAARAVEPEVQRAAGRARGRGGRARGAVGRLRHARSRPTSTAHRAPRPWPATSPGPPAGPAWSTWWRRSRSSRASRRSRDTKLGGLVERYGFEEGPATEYFALHAERDHEHAAQSRELIERAPGGRRLGPAAGGGRGGAAGQLGAARRRRAPARPLSEQRNKRLGGGLSQ